MKTKRICPKCNGTDIIMVPGKAGAYGVGIAFIWFWADRKA